jgi:serine/threonine protein kinase
LLDEEFNFFHLCIGHLLRSKTNPYPRQTLSGLLTKHTDLSPVQREAAAMFIGDCLRLNPFDRLTVDQLHLHQWLDCIHGRHGQGASSKGECLSLIYMILAK